ncbi:hypothetical protein [Bacillus sp. FJAT-29814]|uniref:hypothetical protein n=1 Tax=Bacillus sp. FJAT-29814 TaxID=1729688 RepID=UPI00082CFD99|nr:hypothetical protein [Bacillus sp. FJAT-29814]
MIDKRKNAFYINQVNYISKTGEYKSFVIYSHHGISSKRFAIFLEEYIKNHIRDFANFQEEWGSQQTISNEQFCY